MESNPTLCLSPSFFQTKPETKIEQTPVKEIHVAEYRFDGTEEKTHTSNEQIQVEDLVQQIYSAIEEM